jgi:dipeptidyl-peptidase-4
MITGNIARAAVRTTVALIAVNALAGAPASAQDRLRTMPAYEQYQRSVSRIPPQTQLFVSGAIQVPASAWVDGSRAFEYTYGGKRYRFDIAKRASTELPVAVAGGDAAGGRGRGRGGGGRGGGAPDRGRQFESATTRDGRLVAEHRDRNLWIANADGSNRLPVTTDGSAEKRIKYGTASWVYGEELNQTTAMWWNAGGTKLAYYRFDESKVPDYHLQLGQTSLYGTVDTEAYPKAGATNPLVDLYVYDVATKRSVQLDIRDGKPFTNDVVGHYVYNVRWAPGARNELLVNRTNRRQNIMEMAGCSPETGKCRVIIREEWPTGWVDNSPRVTWLADSTRFIWPSERTGFENYYLYDLTGKLHATITNHQFEVGAIVQVDERTNQMWYMARSGENVLKLQLHRVGLDGRNDRRLTDPAFHHTATLSPDRKYIIDVAQSLSEPPVSRLLDADGRLIAEVAKSDLSRMDELGIRKTESFSYLAADGRTPLRGMISFPSNFDPSKKYPVLASVYGGPGSAATRETFAAPPLTTEYGFIVVALDTRASPGMGKRTLDALYMKLGQTEIDDMAAGVKALHARPYIDASRVGIYGTSYGGYSSVMALLRYPDVFHAASASSPVTAWDHYDTIYTERYMWIPQENAEGYRLGSAMTYVNDLKGRLMLYYGTADNNVHPSNTMQLIQALRRAGKSFEVQVGPDAGHSGLGQERMMEFFIENLKMRAAPVTN